jgi:hypothetical protein
VERPSSIVQRPASIVVLALVCALFRDPVAAQDRLRLSVNAAQQTSTTTVTQEQTFDQYFEQGSYTFDRAVPQGITFDGGALVRVWKRMHAGAALSYFEHTGSGTVTARVPHPLQFNQARTTTGDIAGTTRREIGQHFMFGWNFSTTPAPVRGRPAPYRGLDFTLFAGPSIFLTDQLFVTSLMLSLDEEVFPFTELAFPAPQSESLQANVFGYNAGVDMTWRFSRHFGAGLLLRYSHGVKAFEPTGAQAVDVTVGGLHAGGGLRVLFNSFGSGRKPPPKQPPAKQPPAKQPPAKQPPPKQPTSK